MDWTGFSFLHVAQKLRKVDGSITEPDYDEQSYYERIP